MKRYVRSDFEPVPVSGLDAFYCPGCNASADDYAIPSVGCPCESYGTGAGSLTGEGVDAYLRESEAHAAGHNAVRKHADALRRLAEDD
jgi:hypothetical protein